MMGVNVHDHWSQRVGERCPEGTDAAELFFAVRNAIRDGNAAVAERVMDASHDGGRSVWRVFLPCGSIRYVVACDETGNPVTILTQEQIRSMKAARREGRGRRAAAFSIMMADVLRNARQATIRKRNGYRR